jgi:2'-5' RNA ligase
VGVSEGVPEVQRLQARVAETLERRGVPIEARAWQAHVTIGRVTDDKRWRREGMAELRSAVIRGAATALGTMAVTSIALMRSDLYNSGARYTGIASVPLSSEYDV